MSGLHEGSAEQGGCPVPRLVACAPCAILQRLPDPAKGTPYIPARLQWETGEEFIYKDDDGKPLMVPAYDPLLENFVQAHDHHMPEEMFLNGQVINVWQVDQKTWDSVDVVTKIKTELNEQYQRHFEDRDAYRDGAAQCSTSTATLICLVAVGTSWTTPR